MVKVRPIKPDVSDADAVVTDVRLAKTFYAVNKESFPPRKTGTADLSENQNAESVIKATEWTEAIYVTFVANDATLATATVVIAVRCLIVVVAQACINEATAKLNIKRGGVTKTIERTVSGADDSGYGVELDYTTEVLDAGTYQYDLVNNAGWTLNVVDAGIKIVAVTF